MNKQVELYRSLHKKYYLRFLDELDVEIIKDIMSFPYSENAQLLNARVEAAIKQEIGPEEVTVQES